MSGRYLIGIDLGTSGCKSLLMDEQGDVVRTALEEYPLAAPKPGWYEQDPAHWWDAVKRTLRSLMDGLDGAGDIRSIGLSGQMHGLVALGQGGEVLRPCMIWADFRNAEQVGEVYERVGGVEALLELTNNRMLASYTGGKILWMRKNEPRLYEKTRVIFNPKDYIRYRLTGEWATDVSDASGTGLFDVRNRRWSEQLLRTLDIPRAILPKAWESNEVAGQLSRGVAEETGFPHGIPVVAGGGDAVVQATGTGLVHEGLLGITIGTGGIVSTALESCHPNPEGKLQVFCMNSADTWHAMGVSLTVGGALKWLKDACRYGETDAGRHAGEEIYDSICREAETVEPGSEGLLFLPHLVGSRCPFDDADARGAFVGFTLRHERRHMFRALMESCVMSLRDIAENFAGMGIPWRQLRTSGGASKGRLWRQLQADAFDTEVVTMSGASHGGAYGAALIAGSGTGTWRSLKEASEVLGVQTHEAPIAGNVARYQRLLPIYQGLYPALRETFHRIADESRMKGE